MKLLVLGLSVLYILSLLLEQKRTETARKKIQHVIHVNGTRGKSTIVRLIDAGLRASGKYRVYSKTTGTLPRVIGVDGKERPIKRRGPVNISEQIAQLQEAARQGAEVMVIECMAIRPDLQEVCEEKILQANIAVISNVRHDHIPEMGESLPAIAQAFTRTFPENGYVFTGSSKYLEIFTEAAAKKDSQLLVLDDSTGDKEQAELASWPSFLQENVRLALAVCEWLGVDRSGALKAMKEYQADPYAFSLYTLPNEIVFANALSANDPESTERLFEEVRSREDIKNRRCILLLNMRQDRASRTQSMLSWVLKQEVEEIWLLGDYKRLAKTDGRIRVQAGRVSGLPLADLQEKDFIFALGNMAGEGYALIDWVRERSVVDV